MSATLFHEHPIVYVISSGDVTESDFESGRRHVCGLAAAAAAAGADLFQIREKSLSGRRLFELTASVVESVGRRQMKILVNDRADIAAAAGASGVHLTSSSMQADIVRRAFRDSIIIGVSAHSDEEIDRARVGRADFVTFSPVFETESKRGFGPPQGLERLSRSVLRAGDMPVVALGGISTANFRDCLHAGAAGIAGIGIFRDLSALESVVADLRS